MILRGRLDAHFPRSNPGGTGLPRLTRMTTLSPGKSASSAVSRSQTKNPARVACGVCWENPQS